MPYIYETFRDDIVIVKNRLVDKIDPPRFFPLVGPAQLHHCHWKCTVYYDDSIGIKWPFKTAVNSRRTAVVYIDKDCLEIADSDR